MKIDYEKIKLFLEAIETSELPVISTIDIFTSLDYNIENNEDSKNVIFYLQILKDQGLIDCVSDNELDRVNLGFSFFSNGGILIKPLNFRLTIHGHQTLESMNNNGIWEKIKGPLGKLGIEGLKQIPSLAIKLIDL